ncbi:hypothetical protein [Aneurinibacillus danicus]|uniref:Uncharacterized protein n=1 Tax=Aneurinibacillus danicus TaxID=267746 RepID=A0A511VA47_9BACL|nr:hypothetical protein [Aneurinibacillus danicus]GEN35797.1 hypothetical protein ADA01nite_32570 [Aneurinibacillus danicus]
MTGTTYSLAFQPLHSQEDTYEERATKVLRAKEEPNILQEMSFELLKMKAEIRMLKNQNEYLMEQNAKLEKMMQDSYVSKGELHRILKEHGINQKNEEGSFSWSNNDER